MQEKDIIGVVGGLNPLKDMIGNYCFFVYRLRKRNSNNSISIDNDAVVIIDDESNEERVDNEIICLDLVDSDEEHDLDIQLSELFNIEIKRELEDLDELDIVCQQLKKEPSDFFEFDSNYIDQEQNEVKNIATNDPHQASDGVDNSNSTPVQSDSDDSTDTVQFLTNGQHNHSVEPIEFVVNESETTSPPDYPIESADHPNESANDPNKVPTGRHQSDYLNQSLENCVNKTVSNDQVESNDRSSVQVDSDEKLQRTITKVSEQAKRKQGPKIIAAKPIEKRRRTSIFDNDQTRPKPETSTVNKEYIKDKLKSISATKPKEQVEEKQKVKNLAHVKNTIGNRGSFLTDPTQIPVLPKDLKKLTVSKSLMSRRSTRDESMASSSPHNDSTEIPVLSSKMMPCTSSSKSEYKQSNYQNEQITLPSPPIDVAIPSCSIKKLSFSDISKNQPSKNHQTEKEEIVKEDGFQLDPRHKIISELTSYNCRQHKTVESFCKSFNTNVSPFLDTYTDHMEYQR